MAWLARSLANSLRLDDDEADGECDGSGEEEEEEGDGAMYAEKDLAPQSTSHSHDSVHHHDGDRIESEAVEEAQSRGVKEDLTELRHTLTRQLWGVANFLAPLPSHDDSEPSQSDPTVNGWDRSDTPDRSSNGVEGERERPAEAISGMKFRGMDSKFDPVESVDGSEFEEEYEEDPVGVTDEVLAFARNIGMHPETWLDFPLDAEDDLNDFEMSAPQQEHALAIEDLVPRLRALRIELCPCHMSESYFWKVYFVLLHSRLEKHDAEILSSPQVMEARALWMQELKKQTKEEYDWPGGSNYLLDEYENEDIPHDFPESPGYFHSGSMPYRAFDHEISKSSVIMYSTIEHQIASSEKHIIDKEVTEESPIVEIKNKDSAMGFSTKMPFQDYGDDDDDVWPEEEDSDLAGYSRAVVSVDINEDISFSDLEDDLDVSMPIKSKPVSDGDERKSS